MRGNSKYITNEEGLYDRLTAVAQFLRRLHDGTRSSYKKDKEFANFQKVLNQVRLNKYAKEKYDRLRDIGGMLNFPTGPMAPWLHDT